MFYAIPVSITKMFQTGSLGHLSGKIITSFYINDPVYNSCAFGDFWYRLVPIGKHIAIYLGENDLRQ